MDTIQKFDTSLFYFVNHFPHTGWSDFLAEAFSGFGYAWLLWLTIGIVLFIRKERRDHWFWVPVGIAGGLCYFLSEISLKGLFARPRPDELFGAFVVGAVPNSFSFPSTHATVAFAFVYLFSRKEAHWLWLYALATLVCLSRIYLGHHYPVDVIGGALVGTGIGWASIRIDQMIHIIYQQYFHRPSKKPKNRI